MTAHAGRSTTGGHVVAPGVMRAGRQAVFGLLMLLVSAPVFAQEVWLVTYGPGADAWSRFGHNAVMIRDEERGTATNYAFGYFDMERPGFLIDFLRGILIYEGHATDSQREMYYYRALERSVRKQRLNLTAEQTERFHTLLREQVRPENRAYAYDYYSRNCSTRLRDLLDQALDGALYEATHERPARLNLRDHTHRLSQEDFWLHTGLMLVLGPGTDGERSAWEEMFLPEAMANQFAALELGDGPLVTVDHYWYESEQHSAPAEPRHRWASYAAAGVLTVALLVVPAVCIAGRWRWLALQVFIVLNALAGCGLLLLWVASNHEAIWANAFLFLLNPLWLALLPAAPVRRARTALALLAGLTLVGALVLAWPDGYQFRPAQLLWLVPANLAALGVAWQRWGKDTGTRRSAGMPHRLLRMCSI